MNRRYFLPFARIIDIARNEQFHQKFMFTRIPMDVGEFEAMLAVNKPNYYTEMVVIHSYLHCLSKRMVFVLSSHSNFIAPHFGACNGKSARVR